MSLRRMRMRAIEDGVVEHSKEQKLERRKICQKF